MAIATDLAQGRPDVHRVQRASSLPPDIKRIAAKLAAEFKAAEASLAKDSITSADAAAADEDDAVGRCSVSDSEAGGDNGRGPAGGNLFLTCLRLRFEEHGSWEKALRAKSPVREELEDDIEQDMKEVEGAGAGSTRERRRRPTWKEWAGRDKGDDRYRVGDFYRGAVRSARQKWQRRRAWKCASSTTSTGSKCVGDTLAALSPDPNLTFGLHGSSVEIGGEQPPRSEAVRLQSKEACFGSSTNCLAVTSAPLPRLRPQSEDNGTGITRYYFEFRILEWEPLTTSTLMIGFMWNPPTPDTQGREALPTVANELPHAFVAGGDLPRWYLGGRDLGKIGGWRPRIHTIAGSVLGALLEVRGEGVEKASTQTKPLGCSEEASSPTLRMVIFQDGTRRSELMVKLQPEDGWVPSVGAGPHGIIDVCGSVRRVRLLPVSNPPDALLSSSAAS